VLTEHARIVERELRTLPGIGAVTTTASLVRPELVIRPDFARMADLGITSEAIADTLRIATAGDYDQGLAKLNLAQRQVPIVVKLPPGARQDLALIERMAVPGKHGPVAIGNVATLAIAGGPAEIDRYDRLRNVNFEIELNGQPLGEIEQRALALPSLKNLPPGVLQTTIGDAESMAELFQSFGLAMATGVLCIYIVLVLLFKDFVQPVTILAALVLSIPGAFLALFVTGKAISMSSMIGLIMLMGIATKNSILLVDYVILARRDHGLDRWNALARRLPQAGAADRHDHHCDGCRHAADRHRHRHRPELPRADGHRRHRRPGHLDLPQPAGHPGRLHLRGRRHRLDPPAPAEAARLSEKLFAGLVASGALAARTR
jgi:multidrug efflux pump subunit AcrB